MGKSTAMASRNFPKIKNPVSGVKGHPALHLRISGLVQRYIKNIELNPLSKKISTSHG
jgi:hypothetical protein